MQTCKYANIISCLYVCNQPNKICNILLRQVLCKENGLKEMNKYARKRNKIQA